MNRYKGRFTVLIFPLLFLLACFLFLLACCTTDQDMLPTLQNDPPTISSRVDSATYNLGIPLYNADQGKEFWTEFNTQIRPYWTEEVRPAFYRPYFQGNPYLECRAEKGIGDFGVRMALFKTLFDQCTLPDGLAERITGISFNALGYQQGVLQVNVLDKDKRLIAEEEVTLQDRTFNTYVLHFPGATAKEIQFFRYTNEMTDSVGFALDDVYLTTESTQPFAPPTSDAHFLAWLKQSAFRFFDWNYVALPEDQGVVLESYTDSEKVSLSGIGYAYAIFALAAADGYLPEASAKKRIRAMLNWQLDQNWFDGSGGWHGFPHHYFRTDGSSYWPDVSTIDWAICAAGIRVVKQFYAHDPEIVTMAETLLARPRWNVALAENDKIAMGFDGYTGQMNDYRWALAFSEETELVYLEAVASGDLNADIFQTIIRDKKSGFYPSWFGAGFTYNWLQLWTGPIEPYQTNASTAFAVDASTCMQVFDQPLLGLTACSTIKEVRPEGFLNWNRYISNQGGNIHGASLGGVIQISPAPYGAVLALPFTYEKAMTALRAYADMGFYHEYLGLPDNIRIKDLPTGVRPAPNWNPYDINIGPVMLAIEQVQNNRIGALYQSDEAIRQSLSHLIATFGE